MDNQIVIYWILLLFFTSVSLYNFIIRKQCIYTVKLTKTRSVLLVIIPLVFLGMAYYVGENSWYKYLLAISASTLLVSQIVGEGIHKKGIYYHRGQRIIASLTKWEDIKDIKIDINNNKLKSFTNTKIRTRIYPDQYYSSRDIDKIKEFIGEQTFIKSN